MMPSRVYYVNNTVWLHTFIVLVTFVQLALAQCSGTTLLFTATDTYQVFTSVNYPLGYSNSQDCLWRIEADNITDSVRMEITDASIEFHANCVYDYGQVFDGNNTSADSLGKFCGTDTPSYVSTGSYLTVTFKSDYSMFSKGFKARYKSGLRSNLLDDEEETGQVDMLVILGASIGGLVFIVVVTMVIYTYIQAKKAKELRRHPHMHRGRLSRVEPFGYNGGWSYLDGPAPPAYGEIYSSPMSPPPRYTEVDPNPNPTAPLPGRREFMADYQPAQNGNSNNSDSSARERTDTNANTHFIVTSNLRNFVTQGRTRTPNTGGATVNRSVHILNPASLQAPPTETVQNENSAGINIPGQTECLPTTLVAPVSTASIHGNMVSSGNISIDQIERTSLSASEQTSTETVRTATAQNNTLVTPRDPAAGDRVNSPCQNNTDLEDTYSIVSEISLPALPVQNTAQIS